MTPDDRPEDELEMLAMAPLPEDDPRVTAFAEYRETDEFANTAKWAQHKEHVDGSLWAAFIKGWAVAKSHTPTGHRPDSGALMRGYVQPARGGGFGGKVLVTSKKPDGGIPVRVVPDKPNDDRPDSGERGEPSLEDCIAFAVEAHRGQVYPGLGERPDQPFIMHVMRVVEMVSAEARPVAALHDCLEDYGAIPDGLPEHVERAVWLVTHEEENSYEEYIGKIAEATGVGGRLAREVKIADLTTNLRHDPWNILGKRPKYEAAYERLTGKPWRLRTGAGEDTEKRVVNETSRGYLMSTDRHFRDMYRTASEDARRRIEYTLDLVRDRLTDHPDPSTRSEGSRQAPHDDQGGWLNPEERDDAARETRRCESEWKWGARRLRCQALKGHARRHRADVVVSEPSGGRTTIWWGDEEAIDVAPTGSEGAWLDDLHEAIDDLRKSARKDTLREAQAIKRIEEAARRLRSASEGEGQPVAWEGFCGDPDCDEPVYFMSRRPTGPFEHYCGADVTWTPLYRRRDPTTDGTSEGGRERVRETVVGILHDGIPRDVSAQTVYDLADRILEALGRDDGDG